MHLKKNNKDLWLLHQCVIGSRAYGMHIEKPIEIKGITIEASDYDYRGVCIALNEKFYRGFSSFELDKNKNKSGENNDIYSLQKFMKQATVNNPNIIEILFVNDKKLITHTTDIWKKHLYKNRKIFLSKKCKETYKGFALSQLKKMQKHRRWLEKEPTEPNVDDFFINPKNKWEFYKGIYLDYDHKKPGMRERLIGWIDNLKEIPSSVIYAKTHGKKVLFRYKNDQREKQNFLFDQVAYDSAIKDYSKFKSWRDNRNPKRFILEQVMGYDTKDAGHVIRLLDQAEDILKFGNLRVNRPDRVKYWRSVRFMEVEYDDFIKEYQRKIELLDSWYIKSKLPVEPPIEDIEKLCTKIITEIFNSEEVKKLNIK